jgi:pyridoxamine 5'-phosphate oxidase
MTDWEEAFQRFSDWFAEAQDSEPNDPNAMSLASLDPDGWPSVRIVLMKDFDRDGFVFYTNTQSRKGLAIAHEARVGLNFHWKSLRRQVRIEGRAEPVSIAEADEYYGQRPYGSRIGAWASKQSQPLEERAVLEQRVRQTQEQYPEDSPVPRPPHWSGYRVRPRTIEFWKDMPFRLHERWRYDALPDQSGWAKTLLYP